MATDDRIDAYIADAPPFAHPILNHLRALVHRTVLSVDETIKWGMPFFVFEKKNLCGMGAFKAHCSFVIENAGALVRAQDKGMGNFGKIATLEDLPDEKIIAGQLLARVEAIRSGMRKTKPRAETPAIDPPSEFIAALSNEALVFFEQLAPGQRRDYLEWIMQAKGADTRARRIAQAAQWLAEGKKRNWKYEKG